MTDDAGKGDDAGTSAHAARGSDDGGSGRDAALESDALAALLTPIPNGRVLAALCAINGARGQVIETSAGAMAMLDDASPAALNRAAAAVSSFAKEHPLLALERRDGQVSVWRYQGGARGDSLPPGLALNEAPGVVTTLMAGSQTIDELSRTHEDKVFSARMSRFKAFRELRKLSRQAKRERS